jgi:hypothetical protein
VKSFLLITFAFYSSGYSISNELDRTKETANQQASNYVKAFSILARAYWFFFPFLSVTSLEVKN